MRSVAFYVGLVLLAWWLFWHLIAKLTGFHLLSITINNGFLYNGILFRLKSQLIYIKSVRFRLWGNSRMLIIDDLNITKLSKPTRRRKSSKTSEPCADSEFGFCVLPRNFVARVLVRFLLQRIPQINVEVRNASITSHLGRVLEIAYMKFSVLSRYSVRHSDTVKFYANVVGNNFQTSSDDNDKIPPLLLSTIRLLHTFSINTKTGFVENIQIKWFTGDLRISVFNTFKLLLDDVELTDEASTDKPPTLQRLQRLISFHNKLYSAVKQISIHIENTNLFDIPFATTENNQTYAEYFKQTRPKTSISSNIKSASFNFQKLYEGSAGFEVLFDPKKDSPFHLTASLQLLRVDYTNWVYSELRQREFVESDEILNIPNYSVTLKSNMLDNLANGYGFRNSVVELFSSASSPVFDLDTNQLSSLLYNLALLRKFLQLKKLKRNNKLLAERLSRIHESTEDFENTNEPESKEFDQLRDRVITLLNDYYPHLDFKAICEQPRFIIRNNDKEKHRIQIVNCLYSLMNLHIVTTKERDYDSKFNVIRPTITYHEKSNMDDPNYRNEIARTEIVSLRQLHIQLDILKNLKVKMYTEVDRFRVDFSQLTVLSGINRLISQFTGLVEHDMLVGAMNLFFNSEIKKHISVNRTSLHQGSQTKSTLETKIFRNLPSWFVELEVDVTESEILVGSRSLLIPSELINKADEDGDFVDGELRCVRLSLDSHRIHIKNDEISDSESLPSSTSSFDTLTPSHDEGHVYWMAHLSLGELSLDVKHNLHLKHYDEYLKIKNLTCDVLAVSAESERLLVKSNCQSVSVDSDRYNIMALLGSYFLMKELILNPIKAIRAKVKKDMLGLSAAPDPKARKLSSYLDHEFSFNKVDVCLHLSDEFKLKLQLFETAIKESVTVQFMRCLVDSPTKPGRWSRLMCVDQLRVSFSPITIRSDSIRFIQPHGFVVYKLFDNLSITLKTIKHLAACLKGSTQSRIVNPKESKAIKFPNIKVRSQHVSFTMEDDPFDAELGMIYQLGLVEQRKRMEQLSLFENQASAEVDDTDNEVNIHEKYETLLASFSSLWIRKVKVYRAKLTDELSANKKFLFGNEALLPREQNEGLTAYMSQPPLMALIMARLRLNISAPHFDMSDLPDFLHSVGQGMPKDTRYSLMIPTYIELRVAELRMHLRDYPLPLLYLPRDLENDALLMAGHLVISEALVTDKENIRTLKVPLAHNASDEDPFYSLVIKKTLASVKLFTDMSVEFGLRFPSRFVWGQSYQFGIQQIMLNFDQFLKPPVDPSDKLGFWDKLRLVMHGKFRITTKHSLEIAFKGSRDPYDLFGTASGFVLAFSDNVEWNVNEHDDLRSFFNIDSGKVSFYIPNYLSTPLVSWIRDSTKYTFLPKTQFVTTCHAYYLDNVSTTPVTLEDVELYLREKEMITLSGGVNFKVGFLLQRKKGEEFVTECRPHYDIKLFNPEYAGAGHDSYAGFRSDRIDMSMSLAANTEESYNAIRLSPSVFEHFFAWWKLFAGNMMLPVRRGPLFGELKKSMKFSQHMYTNKFQFQIKSLFISHFYRDEAFDPDEDEVECVGIKAKVDEFVVDLHQRKEPRIQVHEALDRNKKIMKMTLSLGEVHLVGIDMRIVSAMFEQNVYSVKRNPDDVEFTLSVFDDDETWFDFKDYEDPFAPSLHGCNRKVLIHPMMYSKTFSYFRKMKAEGAVSEVDTHECLLQGRDVFLPQIELYEDRIAQLREQVKINRESDSSNKQLLRRIKTIKNKIDQVRHERDKHIHDEEEETIGHFNNRFGLVSMLLKWNATNRNLLLKYIHFVQLKKSLSHYLSYESLSAIEDLIQKSGRLISENQSMASGLQPARSNASPKESSKDRLANFDDFIRRVQENEQISEDYLIEIISPQIQLQSDECPDSVVLIAAPSISAKIVLVVDKNDNHLVINDMELEKRFGIILRDSNIFVIEKDDIKRGKRMVLNKQTYGTRSNWPPWLGIEVCDDGVLAGKDKLLVEKTSLMVTYDKTLAVGSQFLRRDDDSDSSQESHEDPNVPARLRVDVPTFVISSTSSQYFTLYMMVTSLLFYTEPMSKSLSEKLEKLKFSIDFQNLQALHQRLDMLHKYVRLMKFIAKNYNFRQNSLNNAELNDYLLLNMESGNVVTEIYLMMHSILNGGQSNNSHNKAQAEWNIRADQIIIHMLEDDRSPIIDFAIANGHFRRRVNEDGSNSNRLNIEMMQGFNLIPHAHYQEFLKPMHSEMENSNLLSLDWTMNRSIGGIKLIDNFEIRSEPLDIKLDEPTGRKLMKYIFRKELESISESPLLAKSQVEEVEDSSSDKSVKFEGSSGKSKTTAQKKAHSNIMRLTGKLQSLSMTSDSEFDQDVEEMIERSRQYLSINSLRANSIVLSLSFKSVKGVRRVLNVEDLRIKLPDFVIERRMLSMLEITLMMKKLIIKTLISHSGRLLKNKFSAKKRSGKHIISKPLKPLKRYAHFTEVAELAEDGLTVQPTLL